MISDEKLFLIIKVQTEAHSSFKKGLVNMVWSFFGWGEEQKMTRNFVSGAFEIWHKLAVLTVFFAEALYLKNSTCTFFQQQQRQSKHRHQHDSLQQGRKAMRFDW